MITEVNAVNFRQNLGEMLNQVQYRNDSIVIKKDGRPVAALIDARRDQVYARLFRDGAPLGEAEALPLEIARDRILAAAGAAQPTLVGSGAALLAETFPELAGAALHPLPAPTPEAVAALTLAADPATSPPQPLYLRAPDATPPSRLPGQPRQPAA